MIIEPVLKRAVAFIDGQNLYYAIRDCFHYTYPNYDVNALARRICELRGCSLVQTRFYTGIPDQADDATWHEYWARKMAEMGRLGVITFARSLRYRKKTVKITDRSEFRFLVGEEKGVDVRIAIDMIRLAHTKTYDAAFIFSQDQDLSEVAAEIKTIGIEQQRWIEVVCAFPKSTKSANQRGINNTKWLPFDKQLYDQCLDPVDYRGAMDRKTEIKKMHGEKTNT